MPELSRPLLDETGKTYPFRVCFGPVRMKVLKRKDVARLKLVPSWRHVVTRKLTESLRADLAALHDAGVVGKVTMREFDALCPPPVRAFSAADIKRLREGLNFSQPVFALHLHTSASTVRKWEQGETHPAGPALKLLNILADKGLQAIL